MNAVAQIFAVLAGLVHVWAWAMESVLWNRPAVQRIFLGRPAVPEVRLWAFNQGFYNLFLALGAIGGVIAYHSGHEVAGRAVALFGCACMVGAGVVLAISDRRLWRGAIGQASTPLVALVAAFV